MSYLTYFTLFVKEDPKEQKGQLITDIRKLRKNHNIIEGTAFEDTWYTCLTDMPNLSEKYQEMFIILYGEGEARDDNWVVYFKNGKGKKISANLVYPDFDMETFNIKKYEVKVFLGEEAVDEYARNVNLPEEERQKVLSKMEEDSILTRRTFATEAERQAYLQGLDDAIANEVYITVND